MIRHIKIISILLLQVIGLIFGTISGFIVLLFFLIIFLFIFRIDYCKYMIDVFCENEIININWVKSQFVNYYNLIKINKLYNKSLKHFKIVDLTIKDINKKLK